MKDDGAAGGADGEGEDDMENQTGPPKVISTWMLEQRERWPASLVVVFAGELERGRQMKERSAVCMKEGGVVVALE